MECYARVFPKVDTFLLCIALRAGALFIGIIGLVFSVCHVYFHECLFNNSDLHKESKAYEVLAILKYVMMVSDAIYGIFCIDLMVEVIKDRCKMMKFWMCAAIQNGFMIFVFELLASPLFFLQFGEELNPMLFDDVTKLWIMTLPFSVIPLVWFYFMIVVTSYYVECVTFKI